MAQRDLFVFLKKKINFSTLQQIKEIKNGLLIGPGTAGKTRLLHEIYEISIDFKAPSIILNKVFDKKGNSLKYDKNIFDFSSDFPILYIAPNYKSIDGYKPNIDEWISALLNKKATAIVCYIKQKTLKKRIENRLLYKTNNKKEQHLDNYPFSYQNLFYKLEKNEIPYFVIKTE